MGESQANWGLFILFQVAVVVGITYILSTLISWLLDVEKHDCSAEPKRTFDIGSFFCWSCIQEFFGMFNVIPGRQTTGFHIGCVATVFYLLSIHTAVREVVKMAFIYLVCGQALSVIATATAFGLHTKPHSDVLYAVSAIGCAFYFPGVILFLLRYYSPAIMMIFAGAFTYAIVGLLSAMYVIL